MEVAHVCKHPPWVNSVDSDGTDHGALRFMCCKLRRALITNSLCCYLSVGTEAPHLGGS